MCDDAYHLHSEPGRGAPAVLTIIAPGLAPKMSICTSSSPISEAAYRVEVPLQLRRRGAEDPGRGNQKLLSTYCTVPQYVHSTAMP